MSSPCWRCGSLRQGLAKAMFNLGLMYEKRRGVHQDAPESHLLEATKECYQAAAEAGVTKAAVNLGVLHLTGRIGEGSVNEAPEWFKKAADQGDLSGNLVNSPASWGIITDTTSHHDHYKLRICPHII